MKVIRKILGVLCILLAIASIVFCITAFAGKFTSDKPEDLVFAGILFCILLPLVGIGLTLFGYFAVKGEYDQDESPPY